MNTKNMPALTKSIALIVIAIVLIFIIFRIFFNGTGAINPNTNRLDTNPSAGLEYAILFNQGELYKQINSDDATLELIGSDLALFAKATRPEFSDKKILIGFTFSDKTEIKDDTAIYNGYYYGVPDKIMVAVTTYEAGYTTLSITNTNDDTNIDESLNLNGPKNRLIVRLPIESTNYSMRYFKSDDKVVAAFYKGYDSEDVDEVIGTLKEAYGDEYRESDTIFNINAVGIFSVDEVRAYSKSEANKF